MPKKIVFLNISSERKSIWDVLNTQSPGVLILAQVLRVLEYNVAVYNNKSIKWHELISADFILFSFYSCASDAVYKISDTISEKCKCANVKIPVRIMGGIHPTYRPDEALEYCEYVIRGEGEISLPALIEEIQKDIPDFKKVSGLSYRSGGKIVHNAQDEMIQNNRILQTCPARDLDPNKKYWNRTPVFTPCRGCPYNCHFCSQPFGKKMRLANPDWTVDEFEKIIEGKYYNPSKVIFIGSDNFTANKQWAKEVLRLALRKKLVGKINLHIQARTDFANDSELLELMKLFVTRVYIGVESFDEASLKRMNKGITAGKMIEELEIIIKSGILTHCHFIFGTDFDTPESIKITVNRAKKMGIYAVSLFCATPFPGTRFRDEMIAQKRIITSEWSYYNLHHIVVAPLLGKPSQFQIAIEKGYKDFYSFFFFLKNRKLGFIASLYNGMFWAGFKKRNKKMKEYIAFLKAWEKRRY